jgi:DNA-binding CsgD family transcriptional regulator/PAS domain-containing protein
MTSLPTGVTEFSSLVDRIYACVLDRRRWSEVLAHLCPAIGGCAASLNVHALPEQQAELVVEHGTDPERSRAYVEVYGKINPLFDAALLFQTEGEVRTLYSAVDLSKYHRSQFYREWVQPQGWGDWLGGVLIRSNTSLALLAVARREEDGAYTPSQIEFAKLVLPHIQRATVLGRLFDDSLADRAGLTALVERIRAAAFLVDREGVIVFANRRAEQILADPSIFREQKRAIAPVELHVRRLFSEALTRSSGPPLATTLPTASGRRLLSVIPPSEQSGGLAIVLVTTPDAEPPVPGPLLMEAYGLTRAEIGVLVALLKRRTLAEIAAELGVTQRTVKAHLQKLFQKTGTSRQSDLIQEVLSLAPPMHLF